MGRPAVSKHLRMLSDAGLIEHRSAGTRNLYALAPDGMAAAQQWLVRTWDAALAAYTAEVGRRNQRESPVPPPGLAEPKGAQLKNTEPKSAEPRSRT